MEVIIKKKQFLFFLLFIAILYTGCDNNKEKDLPYINEIGSSIQLEVSYLDFSAQGGKDEIFFDAGTDWEVVQTTESWLKVSPSEGGRGNQISLFIEVNPNNENAERKAQIIVKSTASNNADTLTVRQAGISHYVAINWEEEAQLIQFDPNKGNVSIQFENKVPNFTPELSTIVIPTDTVSYIRVVQSISTNGNHIELQTTEGNMTDLFMNQEFTLSTVPSTRTHMTRSGQISTTDEKGVIHPTQIYITKEDGQKQVIYDLESGIGTRSNEIIDKERFFYWGKNLENEKLYEDGGVTLQWDKCLYEAAIDGTFYFNFGSSVKISSTGAKVSKGELYGCFCILEGSMNFDFLLHLIAQSKHHYETEEPVIIIDHLLGIRGVTFKFPIPGGPPVYVTVDPALKEELFANSEARCDVTGGFNAGASLKIGAQYIKDNGVRAIEPVWKHHFNIYQPEIKVKGQAEAGVTVYPDIRIRFFNFAGFDIQIKPTIGDEFTYGGKIGGTGQNYAAWRNRLYQQLDIFGNLSLDFIGLDWKSNSIRLGGNEQIDLVRTPDEILFTSPENEQEMNIGETINAQVLVKDFQLFGESQPVAGALVKFEVVNGTIDVTDAITNVTGHASVNYTPTAANSLLTAKILDADGKQIDVTTFKPELNKKEFDIVGTWKHKTGTAIGDLNGNIVKQITWDDKLTFTKDGRYKYEHNPEEVVFNFEDSLGKPHTSLSYGSSNGYYIFNDNPLQLTLNAGSIIDKSTSDGWPQPGHITQIYSVFGKSGTYKIIRAMNDDGSLNNSVFGIEFTDPEGKLSNIVFEKVSDSIEKTSYPYQQKSSVPPYIKKLDYNNIN